MPPATATSRSPARIAASSRPAARRPDAQTLLIVSDGTSFGMPAAICAWRDGIWPCAGLQHLAHDDVLDLLGRHLGALERGADRDAAQLRRRQGGEPAAEPADGCPRGAEDDGPGHGANDSLRRGSWRSELDHPTPRRDTGADTIVVGVFEGEGIAHDIARRRARRRSWRRARPSARFRHLAHHARRRAALDPRRARRARRLRPRARARRRRGGARPRAASSARATLCWELPHHVGDAVAGALVEGTLLAAYALHGVQVRAGPRTRGARASCRLRPPRRRGGRGRAARVGAEAANAARDLGNAPRQRDDARAPRRARARARRAQLALSVEVLGRDGDRGARAWARSPPSRRAPTTEPQLITLRYEPDDAPARSLGLVGKAVTFDTGGYLDQARRPHARDEVRHVRRRRGARGHRARSRGSACPSGVVAVVGATENMISGARDAPRRHRALARRRSRSRSTTRTPRAASCSPTASPTRASAAPSAWSTSPRSPAAS